jgi:hypothetical protein
MSRSKTSTLLAALAIALLVALLVSACGPLAPAPTATPTAAPTATPTAIPPLTLDTLKNAEYQSEFPKSKKARLTDGKYEEEIVPGAASKLVIVIYPDMYAFGDLNGDGVNDAAVVLAANMGGSGTFVHLAAVVNQNGTPQHVASVSLGDRVKIEAMAIKAGVIMVDVVTHGPQDPLCCPTQKATKSFRLLADKLAPVQ